LQSVTGHWRLGGYFTCVKPTERIEVSSASAWGSPTKTHLSSCVLFTGCVTGLQRTARLSTSQYRTSDIGRFFTGRSAMLGEGPEETSVDTTHPASSTSRTLTVPISAGHRISGTLYPLEASWRCRSLIARCFEVHRRSYQ
jgi:hypothetical protein